MVISAGIGEENKSLFFDVVRQVINTNIQGLTCTANWGINYFKRQEHSHLLNISTMAGIRGNGIARSYNASKAYQKNYLERLRLNAKHSSPSIYITDVRPGYVDTAVAKGNGLFWVAPVQKAADQIFEAIKQKKQVVYITKRWRLISYLLKVIPCSILKRVLR